MNTHDAPLKKAISVIGGTTKLAKAISATGKKVRHSTVYKWMSGRVPAEYCIAIEKATGVSRHDLRPDVFGNSPE